MFALIFPFVLLTLPLISGNNLYENQGTLLQQRFVRQTPFYSLQTPELYIPTHNHYAGTSSNVYHAVVPQQLDIALPYVYSNLKGYVQRPNIGQDSVLVNIKGIHNTIPATSVLPTSTTLPVYYTDCPCNQYTLVEETRQIVCVCLQLNQLPIKYCPEKNVCLSKHACSDGEINIIEYVTYGIHTSVEPTYCNDITHTCCRLTYPMPQNSPQKSQQKSKQKEKNQIDNNISNSTINKLNNNITRYIIHGNVVKIENNGNPFVPIVEEEENGKEDNTKENKTEQYDYTTADIDPRYIRTLPIKVSTTSVFKDDDKKINVVPLKASRKQADVPINDEDNIINNVTIANKINTNKTSDLSLLHSPSDDEHDSNIVFPNNEMNPARRRSSEVSSSSTTLAPHTQPTTAATTTKVTTATSRQFQQASDATTLSPMTSRKPTSTVSTTVAPFPTKPESLNDILKGVELEKIFGTPDKPLTLPVPSSPFTQNIIKIETTSSPSPVPTSTRRPKEMASLRNTNGKIAQLRNSSRTNATIGAILRTVSGKLENVNRPPPIVMSRINVEHLRELFAHGNPTIVIIPGTPADAAVIDGNDNESRQTYVTTKGNEKVENMSRIVARCAADMKCVQKSYCTADGIVSNVRTVHSEQVQLPACMDEESGIKGVCCTVP